MGVVYLVPNWFYGYDIFFQVFFGLTTLLVALYAWRIYRFSGQLKSKLFGTSFLFIAASYFIWAVLNAFDLSEVQEGLRGFSLTNIIILSNLLLYAHIFFFISGLALLAYTVLKGSDFRTLAMLLSLSYAAIYVSRNMFMATYALSVVFLTFICYHYYNEYRRTKNRITCFILAAFIFLLGGSAGFVLLRGSYINYITFHALQLVAYLIILGSLIKIVKHGEKKK